MHLNGRIDDLAYLLRHHGFYRADVDSGLFVAQHIHRLGGL